MTDSLAVQYAAQIQSACSEVAPDLRSEDELGSP
jgi:hypothetical protein